MLTVAPVETVETVVRKVGVLCVPISGEATSLVVLAPTAGATADEAPTRLVIVLRTEQMGPTVLPVFLEP